jgi:hypothetical protein
MATTAIISRTDYLAGYDPGASPDAETTTRIDARLLDVSAAVMLYLGWRENDAGNLTLASTAHTMVIADSYPLRDAVRLTLPLGVVTAVTDVRSGEDVGGTSGTDYTALVSGTDYRLDAHQPPARRAAVARGRAKRARASGHDDGGLGHGAERPAGRGGAARGLEPCHRPAPGRGLGLGAGDAEHDLPG